jgi:hypothetical protein
MNREKEVCLGTTDHGASASEPWNYMRQSTPEFCIVDIWSDLAPTVLRNTQATGHNSGWNGALQENRHA